MVLIRSTLAAACWISMTVPGTAGDVAETPYPISKGDWFVETDLVRWSREQIPGEQANLLVYGESLIGYGLTNTVELQTSFFPYAVEEVATADGVTRSTGGGDVALRANIAIIRKLADRFGVSLLPFVRLPTGFGELRVDRIESGLAVPMALTVADALELSITTLIERVNGSDATGRIWAISTAISLDFAVTETIGAYFEITNVAENSDLKTWGTMAHVGAAYTINDHVDLALGYNLGLSDPALDREAFLRISTLW